MISLAKTISLTARTLLLALFASLVISSLSGCQSNPSKPTDKPNQADTKKISGLNSNKVVIQGVVTYTENLFLLGNQTLVVKLEDVSRQDAPAELIAEDKHDIKGQIPITFAVHYDKRQLKVGHRYNLKAQILDTDTGAINWLSPKPYPYVPGITDNINIQVRSYSSQVRKASQFQTFSCGKKREKLTILLIGKRIQLSFQNRKWILLQVPSASGAKYQGGPITFWMKGANAVYMEQGKPSLRCALQQ